MFRKLIQENSAQSLILKAPKVIMILMVIVKPGSPFGHLVYPVRARRVHYKGRDSTSKGLQQPKSRDELLNKEDEAGKEDKDPLLSFA